LIESIFICHSVEILDESYFIDDFLEQTSIDKLTFENELKSTRIKGSHFCLIKLICISKTVISLMDLNLLFSFEIIFADSINPCFRFIQEEIRDTLIQNPRK